MNLSRSGSHILASSNAVGRLKRLTVRTVGWELTATHRFKDIRTGSKWLVICWFLNKLLTTVLPKWLTFPLSCVIHTRVMVRLAASWKCNETVVRKWIYRYRTTLLTGRHCQCLRPAFFFPCYVRCMQTRELAANQHRQHTMPQHQCDPLSNSNRSCQQADLTKL